MGEDNYIEQLQLRPAQVMARVFRQNITLHFYNRFLQSRLFRKQSQLLNGAFETLIISKEDETKIILLGSRIFNWTDTIIKRSFRNKGSIKIVLCAAKYANTQIQTFGRCGSIVGGWRHTSVSTIRLWQMNWQKNLKNSTIVIQDNNSRYNILLHCRIGKKKTFSSRFKGKQGWNFKTTLSMKRWLYHPAWPSES